MSFNSTPIEEIPVIRDALVKGFASGKTKNVQYRKDQLIHLSYLLHENRSRFVESLAIDLKRPALETDFLEIDGTIAEVREAYTNVEKWSKPESPAFSLNWFSMNPKIRKEPKGVVLIIGPFNVPLWCLLGPLAGAIAAGNTVAIKPSEMTPMTADVIAELFPKYLDPEVVRVVKGGIPQTSKLLEYPWGHICYTGSQRVAKIIGVAAAQTLTPVTFELGGKSPVIVDTSADLKLAARRILWGKCANAGQLCVAPDYVLVLREVEEQFIRELQQVYTAFFGSDPAKSDSISRIVSPQHTLRIKNLVESTKGNILIGGQIDVNERYVAPTIVTDVPGDDSLMTDEIFGPVLPIISVDSLNQAIGFINSRDHPLVLYIFSEDKKVKEKVFSSTNSGGAVANDVVILPAAAGLPFGGIGASGFGYTTGKWGFNTFTHFRGTLDVPSWLDKVVLGSRFPPYTDKKLADLKKNLNDTLPLRPGTRPVTALKRRWGWWILLALLSAIGALRKKRFVAANICRAAGRKSIGRGGLSQSCDE
ncbi:unnamed protein product [Somion occarium]|uniref:Aldehyde dehydrogenase n=1 Tax=Somion occarium TaxID=3059160 RepID=A0ABP1CWA1_9APHY